MCICPYVCVIRCPVQRFPAGQKIIVRCPPIHKYINSAYKFCTQFDSATLNNGWVKKINMHTTKFYITIKNAVVSSENH